MSIDHWIERGAPPVVAILRGIEPHEAVAVGRALIDAGIRLIEVPFNSPSPEESIARMVRDFAGEAMVGGGTVLTCDAAERLAATGGKLMVTPNTDAAVIARGVVLGLEVMPGFLTPSEAFTAIAAGARRLKLFPGGSLGPGHLRAVRDVIPRDIGLWAVGGAGADNLGSWLDAGAEGIGVGGALYRPGDAPELVAQRARALVAAWEAARKD